MNVMGIDPGKAGAFAFVADSFVSVTPMPIIKGDREEYDLPSIADYLRHANVDHVVLERLQPLPAKMGGSIASYQRGLAFGLIVGILTTLAKRWTAVRPQDWQKVMLAGIPGDDTKQRSLIAAQRLFPTVDLRRTTACKKPSDGFADALLLAEFGRRTLCPSQSS